ncbi:MAG: hypothetical protein ACHQ2Z_05950 [Elusimicrobiota bacterium]
MNVQPTACATAIREIWTAWPEAGAVPAAALSHASVCVACAGELEAFRVFCARGAAIDGRSLAWSRLLPAARQRRLAAATRRALAPAPRRFRPLVLVPALAAALAALVFRVRPSPQEPPLPSGAIEAVENRDMLEHLDLLENMDLAEKLADRPRGGAQ